MGGATLLTLGRVLLTRGLAAEALRVLTEIRPFAGQACESTVIETWSAWAMVDAGRWPEARQVFQRLLGATPGAYQTGWLLAGLARLELLSRAALSLDSDASTRLAEWQAPEDGA